MTSLYVIISSPPGSAGAQEGISLARERTADIVLAGTAVPLAGKDALKGFCGTVYALKADISAYKVEPVDKGVRVIDGPDFHELLSDGEVIGRF